MYKILVFLLHWCYNLYEISCDFWNHLKRQLPQKIFHARSTKLHSGTKIPIHLTFLLCEEKASAKNIAKLVTWSVSCGIKYVSFYDHYGTLKESETEIQQQFEKCKPGLFQIAWHGNHQHFHKNGFTKEKVHVKIISPSDGRETIGLVCKEFARIEKSSNVNIKNFDKALSEHFEFPNPELAIYFGKYFNLKGYPPWQVHVTEFMNLPSLCDAYFEEFVQLLYRFSACEQRLGK